MRTFIAVETQDLPDSYDAETLGAPPLVEVKESAGRIDIAYRFPGFFRTDREHDQKGQRRRFDALEVGGAGHLFESGRPQLPSFGRYVQIPPGCDFKVSVKTVGQPVQLDGVVVAPAQANLTDGPARHELEIDTALYGSDEPYPKDLVSVTGPLVLDGYHALLVHVCPFQFRPKRSLLVAYPRVEVAIELTPQKGARTDVDTGESREGFGNLFLNPRRDVAARLDLPAIGTVGPVGPIGPVLPIAIGPELLVVYATAFAAPAKRLADWKNRRGLVTDLLEFKAGSTFAWLKGEIRKRRSIFRSRLRYVVLVGDTDDIPTEERGGNTTDYYLSTSADYDAAKPPPMPVLALGRIPIRNAVEAGAVVDQIIAYERTPPADVAYYHRFVCAGHFETHPTASAHVDGRDYVFTMEAIRSFLVAQGFDAERVYTCDCTPTAAKPLQYMNGTPVPADVVASIMAPAAATQRLVDATTEGHLFIGHRDHGDVDGWVMPPFKLGDLDKVTGTMPSLFYSVNCLTGAYDRSTTTECFAERILRQPGTAPTLLAATELSSTWINNAMMRALFDAMYGGMIPTFPGSTVSYPIRFNRFGDLVNYARSYLAVEFAGNPAGYLSNYEMYHVFGDPSLEVWAAEPKPLRIVARLGRGVVNVELSAAAPDCVVTVWAGDRLVKRLTPSGQRFSIPIPPFPGPLLPLPARRVLSLCAWAPGFRFAEAKLLLPVLTMAPAPVA